jgi:predicted GIY-YIG superfamily endonuclease
MRYVYLLQSEVFVGERYLGVTSGLSIRLRWACAEFISPLTQRG